MSPPPPRTRAVLVGASNLEIGFADALAALRARFAGPIEVLAAHGLGRSYGLATRVLGRELPGIAGSGLWSALERAPALETIALVTDPGNDVVYGVETERTAGWIGEVLGRLARAGARTVVTRPPIAAIERISRARFEAARVLLFRARPLTLEGVIERTRALDRAICAICAGGPVELVEPEPGWYGWDAIHLRRRARREVFERLVARLPPDAADGAPPGDAARGLPRLWLRPRERERWWGRERGVAQPALSLDDGSTIALY